MGEKKAREAERAQIDRRKEIARMIAAVYAEDVPDLVRAALLSVKATAAIEAWLRGLDVDVTAGPNNGLSIMGREVGLQRDGEFVLIVSQHAVTTIPLKTETAKDFALRMFQMAQQNERGEPINADQRNSGDAIDGGASAKPDIDSEGKADADRPRDREGGGGEEGPS